jgi:hypothetical protein
MVWKWPKTVTWVCLLPGLCLAACGTGSRKATRVAPVGAPVAGRPEASVPPRDACDDPGGLECVRSACARAMADACSALARGIRDGKFDPTLRSPVFGSRWVEQRIRLTPESDTSVELVAHPGARLLLLDVVGDTAFALVASLRTTNEFDDRDPLMPEHFPAGPFEDDGIVVSLPASALSDREISLKAPVVRGDAIDQGRTLYGAAGATNRGVPLQCGPVEIMAELPGNVQQLRQVHQGIELRGFTRIPLEWSWDDNHCAQRIVRRASGEERAPAIPSDLVAVRENEGHDAVRYLKRGKPVYSVHLTDTGLACAKVTYAKGTLKTVVETGRGRARHEIVYSGWFSDAGDAELDGPAITTFDERGIKVRGIAFGCISYLQLVRETPAALELVTGESVVAYHPDDVALWYKKQIDCEAAIAAHPRLRLELGRRPVAAAAPLRLFGGC